MFESLSDRFDGIFTKLRGKGRLSEADVDESLTGPGIAWGAAKAHVHMARHRK